MNKRLRSIPLVIALAMPVVARAESTDKEVARYAASKYTYCDAKVLSSLWRQSIEEAKARIGRKLGWGDTPTLNGMLSKARERARKDASIRCTFHEAGFTYRDAERLAKYWKMSTDEAKANVEDKIVDGNEHLVRRLLAKK